MQNSLLVVLREMRRYTPAMVAQKLEIDKTVYSQIESGELLLKDAQAKAIGQLYKVKPALIYESALQLDTLLMQKVLILTLKSRLGDVNDNGDLKELCRKTIKVCGETDKFLKLVNDHTQQMAEAFEKASEVQTRIMKQTNDTIKRTDVQIAQNDEIYDLVKQKMGQATEFFEDTRNACQQTIKEISEMNDLLKQENAELRKKLSPSS